MNKKHILLYIAALVGCFLLGCVGALTLRAIDARPIQPLQGGKTVDFDGFSLSIPQDYTIADHTADNLAQGGGARYAGSMTDGDDALYLFCYDNPSGDSLADYAEQDVVAYYMRAGATEVRTRELGGRRFICYRASVTGEDGRQLWDTYETWDEARQISFETQMAPARVLPILSTIRFD